MCGCRHHKCRKGEGGRDRSAHQSAPIHRRIRNATRPSAATLAAQMPTNQASRFHQEAGGGSVIACLINLSPEYPIGPDGIAEDDRHQYARADQHEDLAAFRGGRSEEHTSELQSLMRISYAVFCLKKKTVKKCIKKKHNTLLIN